MNAGPESAQESNPENAAFGASPSGFCMGCSYPLTGLIEHRCPECGRSFDPANPRSYRRSPKRKIQAYVSGTAIAVIGLILVFIVIESGLDYGHASQSCEDCGARSRVRLFEFFGIGGEYGRVVDTGPTSMFIQRRMDKPCSHSWQLCDDYGGSLIRRYAASGAGLSRYWYTQQLDRFGTADNLKLFERHAAEDPAFADRFIRAVRNPKDDETYEITNELLDCLNALSAENTQ